MAGFAELGIVAPILRALDEMGYEEPSPVQEHSIPSMLQGKDVVVQALTGTGKTAAFGVPLLQQIDPRLIQPQAIILAPTRELAIQVSDMLTSLSRHLPIWVVPIYGGQPIGRQIDTLRRGVHVIVATPGRMLDHLNRGTVRLDQVKILVLDEADQMLEMGFLEDVEAIIAKIPENRQTALFSATIPNPILDLARAYMKNQEVIRLTRPRELTVPQIEQQFVVIPFPRKIEGLVRILEHESPERALIFCSTKRMVDTVTEDLRGRGFRAAGLHGDMSQAVREGTLGEFRRGHIETLVATDVAARGLDIPDVAVVVNFDIPVDPESYTHRIGRTGRMGKQGLAITFVNPREMRELKVIERITGARIRKAQLPTPAEVAEREQAILEQRIERAIQEGHWAHYLEMAEELAEEYDLLHIAAAAISLIAGQGRRTKSEAAVPREGAAGASTREGSRQASVL